MKNNLSSTKRLFCLVTYILVLLITNPLLIQAQIPSWQWVNTGGGYKDFTPYGGGSGAYAYDYGKSTAVDKQGNVYIAGHYESNEINFGTTTLINSEKSYGNTKEMYVAKYDNLGKLLWAKSFGGNRSDEANSISTDPYGNFYLTGYFISPTLKLGTISLTRMGAFSNYFIAKFDSTGNVIWAKNAGGTAAEDYGKSIVADSNYVYVAGCISSPSISFGTATIYKRISAKWKYNSNFFVAKYDIAGNLIWAKSGGGEYFEEINQITTDKKGGVYIVGNSRSDSFTFAAKPLIRPAGGLSEAFVAKYDGFGNELWANRGLAQQYSYGNGITTDFNGYVYITGGYVGYYNIGTTYVGVSEACPSFFKQEIFIAKYDQLGNFLWLKSPLGGKETQDAGYSICTDVQGYIYLGAQTLSDTLIFNKGTIKEKRSTALDGSMIVVKFDSSGDALWSKPIQSKHIKDIPNSITSDKKGNLYITGSYTDPSISFTTTTVRNSCKLGGSDDIFVAKLGFSSTTDIAKIGNKTDFLNIYPNPSDGLFYLQNIANSQGGAKIIDYKVYNAIGNCVQQHIEKDGQELRQFDFRSLSTGIYYLQLIGRDGLICTKKIVIQK